MMQYFIGVDVGTASARAALVREDGKLVSMATHDIKIWNPKPNFYQQSSANIWKAVVHTIKRVVEEGKVLASDVRGIGFDATCSLVVLDRQGQPVSVCPNGTSECDIVMWMDHRASQEADDINATKHEVLKYTGGNISLEMEPPKMLWLKKNLRDLCWSKAHHFFDLCDYLTWRATGSFTRSLCAVVCKWTYTKDRGFCEDFYTQIGLEDLCENNFEKIGSDVKAQGESCGNGLTQEAAAELGLKPHTPVSVGIIDAHCAALGCVGCIPRDLASPLPPLTSRLGLISGSSTCHMLMSKASIFVPGVWGPYWSAIMPGFWDAEGGQSAAGKLIDFVMETHPAYKKALETASKQGEHITDYLYTVLEQTAKEKSLSNPALLTHDLHIWPDYHGNRSPLADHTLTGMICGLTLQSDVESLACMYLATVQALAYGTRHILSALRDNGHSPDMLFICGGLRKNALYLQTHADVTGVPIVVPDEPESVLLGGAILGAAAAKRYPSIQECMDKMCGSGMVTYPNQQLHGFHSQKYSVFLQMYADQKKYKALMSSDQS